MRSEHGWWYYFPAMLSIKTPLALIGLTLLMAAKRFRAKGSGQTLALAFAGGVLAASMTGHIDIGVRYVLPVYAGMSVACGTAAAAARGWVARTAVAALLVWQVISGVRQHPDYLAYTNEVAGSRPERFLADSDVDWGQDMKRLAAFLKEQRATTVTFTPFNRTYPMPVQMVPGSSDAPSAGWNAVSVTIWKVFGFPAWADRVPEQRRIGRSILVWYFAPGAESAGRQP